MDVQRGTRNLPRRQSGVRLGTCQDRVAELATGARLEVICTDPGVMHDIPAWCRINGHTVIEAVERDGEYIITVEVGSD